MQKKKLVYLKNYLFYFLLIKDVKPSNFKIIINM